MFTTSQLKEMIAGKSIGEHYPYNTGNEQDIMNYLKRIKAELEKTKKITCQQEPLHFGSGYASFLQWLVFENTAVQKPESEESMIEKRGLIVLISMLAPVVLIGKGEQSSGMSFLTEPHQLLIPEEVTNLYQKLQRLFMKYHYTILYKEDVEKRLPFQAEIPTILREPRDYLIMDAIFYWSD